jgi:hypothetical protein
MYVMDIFENPITDFNIPWMVRNEMNREGWELVDISYKSIGTPDGECDTDVWELTLVQRNSGQVEFATYYYKEFGCLASPALTEIVTMAEWLDKGIKHITKCCDDGSYISSTEEVEIDKDLIKKTLDKDTLGAA